MADRLSRTGKVTTATLIVAAAMVGGSGCTHGPLDETKVSNAAQRLVDAFGCSEAALEDVIAQAPASTVQLAGQTDVVITRVVESVTADHTTVPGGDARPRVLIDVKGTSADGSPGWATLQLMPALGVAVENAAEAITPGSSLVAYATRSTSVSWCGAAMSVLGDAETPVSPFGLVIATGDPQARAELVWPMLRLTSWSALAGALPGGNQFPSFH
jgi:hypothetical protein